MCSRDVIGEVMQVQELRCIGFRVEHSRLRLACHWYGSRRCGSVILRTGIECPVRCQQPIQQGGAVLTLPRVVSWLFAFMGVGSVGISRSAGGSVGGSGGG